MSSEEFVIKYCLGCGLQLKTWKEGDDEFCGAREQCMPLHELREAKKRIAILETALAQQDALTFNNLIQDDVKKAAKEWLDIQMRGKESHEWDEHGSLVDLIQGLMDHENVDLNLRIVDLEKELSQPFCTEHRKHVSDGFCDECNGDRNLIQPKVKE